MSDKKGYPCETSNASYIKGEMNKGSIKSIVGASALAFKGIKKGTETKSDTNGVGGTWKNA
jgi:hypothetical protein